MTTPEARDAVIAELASRLKAVCAQWPDDTFRAMIERLADITLRYDGYDLSTYDRRTTDRLIADLHAALKRNQEARRDEEVSENEGPDSVKAS